MKNALLLGGALLALAPAVPRPDFAGLYRPGAARLDLDTRREGDSLRVFVRLPEAARLPPGRALYLAAWPGYEARQPAWQDSVRRLRRYAGNRLDFCLPAAQVPLGTVLNVRLPGTPLADPYQDPAATAWLRLTDERLNRPFVLLDSAGYPLGRRYARVGETVGFTSAREGSPAVRWRRYATLPAAALPPFADPRSLPGGPPTLPVLDSGRVAAGQPLRLGQPGLYALRVGAAPRPLGLLVMAGAYPGQATAPELIEPLLYLTTSDERNRLLKAPDPKRAVDKFWLGAAGGDQPQGRELIRRYYAQVTAANELFSAHKAGWLTDRGLIYVVVGPPEGVRRLPSGEERWFYAQASADGGPVSFTFRPRPTTFAPDYYELVRRPEYELLWYRAVEKWRKTTSVR